MTDDNDDDGNDSDDDNDDENMMIMTGPWVWLMRGIISCSYML